MLRHVQERERILEEVYRYCDLRERLAVMPPSAKSRGLYFKSIETVLERAGLGRRYHDLFPEHFAAALWHPSSEFLIRLAVAASLLTSSERVAEGMFEIGRRNAVAFAESLLGRVMLRLLSRDPHKLLKQAVAGRRQSASFGSWEVAFPTERSAVITMQQEYMYIESYLLGAAQGTFDAIALPVKTQVVLDDRFNGKHILEW
jgi:uncharacterized protein (TIGR02265 family)